jgi:co-chaperonin GroES (HSP10)
MKLRPLHDRVIVKRLEQETKTASGIVIPDNAAEKPDQGEVLAVGPGKRNDKGDFIAMNTKVGDRVLFAVDQSTLSDTARVTLQGQAQWLLSRPNYAIIIEGHAEPVANGSETIGRRCWIFGRIRQVDDC